MSPDIKKSFFHKLTEFKPKPRDFVFLGGGLMLLFATSYFLQDYYQSLPVTCNYEGDYGKSTINLPHRRSKAFGTSRISFNTDYLAEKGEEGVSIIEDGDENCPKNVIFMRYLPRERRLIVAGNFYRDNHIENEWSAYQDDLPNLQEILILWNESRVVALSINRAENNTLSPSYK